MAVKRHRERCVAVTCEVDELESAAFSHHEQFERGTFTERILVGMTRNRAARRTPGSWALQDAKSRFSEVVRRAKTDGPQLVTVHGRDEVVVIAADEFRRLKGEPTGRALIDVLRGSPLGDVDLERNTIRSPVRRVQL